ncbi:MAG TPA: hypothetical protein VI757_10770 [Bacteroidia bacterium]|nr:hypothetical protein [Bacteroidia bacterium]
MKTKFLFPVLFFSVMNVSAQKFYATVEAGYAFKASGSRIAGEVDFFTFKNVKGSLGAGFVPTIRGGYILHPNIGFEVGVSYFSGSQVELGPYQDPSGFPYSFRFQGKTIRVMPSFNFTALSRFSPLATIGFIIGAGTEANVESNFSGQSIKSEFFDGNALGWYVSLGAQYKWKNNRLLFIKADMIYQKFFPEKEIRYDYNTATGNNNYGLIFSFDPDKDDSHWFSFNSIGFSAGVKFLLGTKKKDTPQPAEVK